MSEKAKTLMASISFCSSTYENQNNLQKMESKNIIVW